MRVLVLFVVLFLASCASHPVKSFGTAKIQSKNFDDVFFFSVESAMRAGFTIISADKEAGLITANNSLVMSPAPNIDIFVRERKDTITVNIGSVSYSKQAAQWESKDNVTSFCKELSKFYGAASCQVSMRWYDDN